jgi:carboxypeptidase family protein
MRKLRNSLGLSAVILSASLLPASCAVAQTQPSLRVTVQTRHGHPVRDVDLTLAAEDRIRRGVTNAKGEFEFRDLPDLTYVLEATYLQEFKIANIQNIRLRDPGSRTVSVTLDPPGGYFLSGLGTGTPCTLLDIGFVADGYGQVFYAERQGDVSIAGTVAAFDRSLKTSSVDLSTTIAVLSVDQPELAVAKTQPDDRGEFHFDSLAPGKYRVRFSRKGSYTGTTMEFWVALGNTTKLGPITMYPDGMSDMCGTGLQIILFEEPVNLDPELIDPSKNPPSNAK